MFLIYVFVKVSEMRATKRVNDFCSYFELDWPVGEDDEVGTLKQRVIHLAMFHKFMKL